MVNLSRLVEACKMCGTSMEEYGNSVREFAKLFDCCKFKKPNKYEKYMVWVRNNKNKIGSKRR